VAFHRGRARRPPAVPTAEALFRWHELNQDVLDDRLPVADVAVVWSQENRVFRGEDRMVERTLSPYRGVTKALDRAGITWIPVHAEHIARDAHRFGVLVLPNVAAMSDAQVCWHRRKTDHRGDASEILDYLEG
jgi:hypothetical protein